MVVEGVPPGSHLVTLDDFSANCRLTGSPTQTVPVTAGGLTRDTVLATFEGSCEAVTADVQLFATTAGVDRDLNGYTVTADGELVIEPCGFYDYYCRAGRAAQARAGRERPLLPGSGRRAHLPARRDRHQLHGGRRRYADGFGRPRGGLGRRVRGDLRGATIGRLPLRPAGAGFGTAVFRGLTPRVRGQ